MRLSVRSASTPSGGAVRPHSDQLLYCAYFAIDENDIRDLDRYPLIARRRDLEVAGAETQHGPEQIRAELLEVQPVGVKALCATADQVLYSHLPRTYAPISQPIEHKEHQQPNDY